MKSIVVLLVILVTCISPSLCLWGKTKSTIRAEHRSGKSPDELFVMIDEKAAEFEGSGSVELEGTETAVLNSTEEEERLFHKFPLHVFMKKKHPFVTHSTMTKTSTVTAMITSSTVGLCAQLVNVTGPCRMRKGLWVEDPLILSFDDEMDSIDDTLSPSKTSRVETTTIPQTMAEVSNETKKDNRRISVRSGSVIHSSMEDEESRNDEEVNEGRFGFFGLKKKFKKKVKLITVVTTTVMTVTSTSTFYKTVSTKSFFIQICTPSPFPFEVCSNRKRREVEIEVDHSVPPSHQQLKVRQIVDTAL